MCIYIYITWNPHLFHPKCYQYLCFCWVLWLPYSWTLAVWSIWDCLKPSKIRTRRRVRKRRVGEKNRRQRPILYPYHADHMSIKLNYSTWYTHTYVHPFRFHHFVHGFGWWGHSLPQPGTFQMASSENRLRSIIHRLIIMFPIKSTIWGGVYCIHRTPFSVRPRWVQDGSI